MLKQLLIQAEAALNAGDSELALQLVAKYHAARLEGAEEPDTGMGLGDSVWNKLRDRLGVL